MSGKDRIPKRGVTRREALIGAGAMSVSLGAIALDSRNANGIGIKNAALILSRSYERIGSMNLIQTDASEGVVPFAQESSLEAFRRRYVKRIVDLLGGDEEKAASALGVSSYDVEALLGFGAK